MPFIKYFGANRPASVMDHVSYEDPKQPCFQGHAEARIFAWTQCEDAGTSRDQWDAYFRAHIEQSPYPGMTHVGGIGRIEGTPRSPFEEAISETEYEELKRAITAANGECRQRTTAQLSASNDHRRRALPEDEALGWRTRVRIASHTELVHHVPYRVDESCRAYARVREYLPNGMTIQLIDVYHRAGGDALQAVFDGLERAERLVDLLAVAGFGPAHLMQTIGTSPPICRDGVPFKVATLQARVVNSPVEIAPEVFENVKIPEGGHTLLRHVREGLCARLPTSGLASFWNALERQAEEEAQASGLKRTVRCKKCGDERHVGWDIKSGFSAMYARAKVDGDFDRHRSLRGRVQHGAAFFSTNSPEEFLPEMSRLQLAAISSVGRRIGLLPQTAQYILTGVPAVAFDCLVEGESCRVDTHEFKIGAVASTLPMRESANKDRSFQAGLDLPTKVDLLIVPPVISDEASTHEESSADPEKHA